MPAEPMESMLRPFNLVIPFTVQKGELTGTAPGPRGRRAPRDAKCPGPAPPQEMKAGAQSGEVSSPASHSKLSRAGT